MSMLKSDNFEYLLDTRLKKVYEETWKMIPSRRDLLYSTRQSDKAVEYDYTMGDIGKAETFDGQVNYQTVYGQYRTTYTHNAMVTGIRIQRELLDDDQYNVINNQPRLLSRAMKLTKEGDAASTFANAFSSSYTGGDSLPLCDDSHTGAGTSDTQDNDYALELTTGNLKTCRLAMQKFETDKGNFAGCMPNAILCPIDLADTAAEITKSDKVPYEISNTINVNDGRYKVIDWYQLTDTNNWFNKTDPRYN